ncbi:uncharacterized protein LOC111083034 [Limulus polyphemus]|uniref:Uncharacterized protein LOC111083034 n=1 Tax=Limulus polyphemus TaxID=6850 RepID=A0ABM1RU93_LIMPO|nr:uncharacterized protein LOC111083034 [Limulus polyphemus]
MGNELSQGEGGGQAGQIIAGPPKEQRRMEKEFGAMGGQYTLPTQANRTGSSETIPNQVKMTRTFAVATSSIPEVDLSDLSKEEQAKILSVMAKAEHMKNDLETHIQKVQHPRQETVPSTSLAPPHCHQQKQHLCPQCHVTVLTAETKSRCSDCKRAACRKCGTSLAEGDGRRFLTLLLQIRHYKAFDRISTKETNLATVDRKLY